ncbi:transcriptional regulator [Yinghuangia sp. YIM S10712]|uniref:transcriptional regulator n=1 Tax=Yinghuangia sp. YIM S10712 TaxID=3436930 RepID=UPI003F536E0F
MADRKPGNPLLVAARTRLGWRTQQQFVTAYNACALRLGERASITVRQVRRWESAMPPWPREDAQRILRKLFGVPLDCLGFVPPAPYYVAHGQEEDPVLRRTFLQIAGVGGAELVSEPWGRLSAALRAPRVDRASAGALVERTAALFAAEERHPARQLYPAAAGHVDQIAGLIASAGESRLALTVAAGEAAALAGWLAWDIGETDTARGYLRTAMAASEEADHPALGALVLGYASYTVEDPRQARKMLTAGQERVTGPGCATARAWLAAREAEEAAASGDQEGAIRALERARTAYDYADPASEQAWVRFFGPARLDSLAVSTLARLEHRDLEQEAERTESRLGANDAKIRAVVLADVAAAYVQVGNLDRAAVTARQAATATTRGEATLGRQRLLDLVDRLPSRNVQSRELGEELRAVLG